eukprot:8314447-Alexandrium_andersonii.AAC.1
MRQEADECADGLVCCFAAASCRGRFALAAVYLGNEARGSWVRGGSDGGRVWGWASVSCR